MRRLGLTLVALVVFTLSIVGPVFAEDVSVRGYFPTKVFKAERFVLFSSRASSGGGPYVVEDSYTLSR